MIFLRLWILRLLCRHVPTYDGLDSGADSLIVRTKCIRCGKIERSGQPVSRKML